MNALDRTFLPMQKALQLTTTQLRAVAQNIANVQTPGYQRVKVDFSELLRASSQGDPEVRMQQMQDATPTIVVDKNAPAGPDGNSVSMEQEVLALHEIGLRHQLATRMANGKLSSLRLAIAGR